MYAKDIYSKRDSSDILPPENYGGTVFGAANRPSYVSGVENPVNNTEKPANGESPVNNTEKPAGTAKAQNVSVPRTDTRISYSPKASSGYFNRDDTAQSEKKDADNTSSPAAAEKTDITTASFTASDSEKSGPGLLSLLPSGISGILQKFNIGFEDIIIFMVALLIWQGKGNKDIILMLALLFLYR